MTLIVYDSITDVNGTPLLSHVGEQGATWTGYTAYSASNSMQIDSNRVHTAVVGQNCPAYASGIPPSPDYEVSANVIARSLLGSVSLLGRLSTVAANMYQLAMTTTNIILFRVVGGGPSPLAAIDFVPVIDQVYELVLRMAGARIEGYLDGMRVVAVENTGIATAGRSGIAINSGGASSVGFQISRFQAQELPSEYAAKGKIRSRGTSW